MSSELKSDRWIGISEVGVVGGVMRLTWTRGRESVNQRLPHKGFEASKRGLDNRAGNRVGLYS